MPLINVPDGTNARAIHVRQIIGLIRGIQQFSEAVSLTGTTSTSAYALTIANRDATNGLALAARNSNQSVTLLEVKNDGVIVRPNASSGIAFRVRNFLDSADLFSVNVDGSVTLGAINSGRIGDFLDVTQAAAPANPSAGRIRLYSVTASDTLRFRNQGGTEFVLADTSTAQILAGPKTLTSPVMSGPSVSDYLTMVIGSAPSNAGANLLLYYKTGTNDLRIKAGNNTEKTLVDTDSAQTLSNKTLSLTALTGVTLNNPDVANYADFDWVSNPGAVASKARLWAKSDNNMYFTLPSGTIATILTSVNTPTAGALGLSRQLMLSGG